MKKTCVMIRMENMIKCCTFFWAFCLFPELERGIAEVPSLPNFVK